MKLVSRNPEGFDGNSAGQQAKAGIYGSQAWQNQQIIRVTTHSDFNSILWCIYIGINQECGITQWKDKVIKNI